MDAAYVCDRLLAQGFVADVRSSNIQASPYPYVYVWFDAQTDDGPFCIISDVREHIPEGDGYYVGFYKNRQALMAQGPGPSFVRSWEGAIRLIRHYRVAAYHRKGL